MADMDLRERVARLENFVGPPQRDDAVSLAVQSERQHDEIVALQVAVERVDGVVGTPPDDALEVVSQLAEHDASLRSLEKALKNVVRDINDRFNNSLKDMLTMTDSFSASMRNLEADVALLKRAVSQGRGNDGHGSKIKVPEPKSFNGTRSAKDLENFLWDMEQYFKAARIQEGDKVSITGMYLVGDAKLWWRTRSEGDASAGRPIIETWENLKKELKGQFLPCNTSWVARQSLKNLKQSGTIREYVVAFSSLMLEIENMSEADKLFNFMSGLQPWAQSELRRQSVKDLPGALAAAEGLVDFRPSSSSSDSDGGRKKSSVDGKKWKDGSSKEGMRVNENSISKFSYSQGTGKVQGCFICNGPHRARECPKGEKLNALVAGDESGSESDQEDHHIHASPLVLLNTLSLVEADSCEELIFIKVKVNGRHLTALIDMGATNNFVAERLVDYLGLNLAASRYKLKAVNSGALPIKGVATSTLEMGCWKGMCPFMVVPLMDFDLILGMEFFVDAEAMIMPDRNGILVGDARSTYFVPAVVGKPDKVRKSRLLGGRPKAGKITKAEAMRVGEPDFTKAVHEEDGGAGEADLCSLLGGTCDKGVGKSVRPKGVVPRRF